ncbi:competence type IV pilus assembly protein ComGB [Staphylococcus caeli]|uniref:competence type IV pilus assembly protein ComGB n=1 Tax=Staphylococcus caeli TaxID=2201815 RepID=UPI003F54E69D
MKKQWINIFRLKGHSIISDKNKIALIAKLKDLLDHGYTLSESFSFLLQHTQLNDHNVKMRIKDDLQNGANCAHILKLLKFPKAIVTLIYFAELFSDLSITLPHAHEYLLKNYSAKRQFLKTIQYPALLLIIFIGMLVVINHTIIPEFQNLYQNLDVNISPIQFYLSSFILQLPQMLFYIFICLFLIFLIFFLGYKKLSIENKLRFILHIPIVSKFFRLYKTFQISSELSLFYKNGINLQQIVEIYGSQTNDEYLVYLARKIAVGSHNGLKLSETLSKVPCFDKRLSIFIEEGEKKGRLEIEMKLYSEIIIEKIEQLLQLIIKFIQPLVFFLIAILIVSLYLVIMLPMFDLMQTIK